MQTAINALSTPRPASSLSSAQQRRIGELFEDLAAALGGKLADVFAQADPAVVQAQWAAGLAGFRESEIQRGMAEVRKRSFPPNIGEFARLCRPSLDAEWAFYEAGDCLRQRDAGEVGDWSHPAVWRAACAMSQEVRAGDFKHCRTRWTYTLSRELAVGWGEIPLPAMRIDHNAKTRAPTEAELAALQALRGQYQPTTDEGSQP